MQIYLVGGAVRDELLGLPVDERDWVVVGSTPEEMTGRGFRPVGRDFPVFLHPETGEEYALARTERKSGPGYRGFVVHAAADVTLEADLERRDLTINAMARDADGTLVDPWKGLSDLEDRVLRHVSDAFVEDPVRILRVARFAARFHDLGFRVADETWTLMGTMVTSGEVDALVPERVWQETVRALAGPRPRAFFETLRRCGALARIYPELDRLFGVPQPERWHPEVDTGLHTLMCLDLATALSPSPRVRFAALVHDLGKGTTSRHKLPAHPGHEERGAKLVRSLAARLRVPNDFRDLGALVSRFHLDCHRATDATPEALVDLLEATDAFRRPDRFDEFLLACEADLRGRKGWEDRPYPQARRLKEALAAATAVAAGDLAADGFKGPALGKELRRRRCEAVGRALAP